MLANILTTKSHLQFPLKHRQPIARCFFILAHLALYFTAITTFITTSLHYVYICFLMRSGEAPPMCMLQPNFKICYKPGTALHLSEETILK